ncbi:MAG TPA: hypothetical protein VLD62_12475 [Acidimicrobiia bacterium]|nr:hypothetical protein [Acidimicrobiia bacterium]
MQGVVILVFLAGLVLTNKGWSEQNWLLLVAVNVGMTWGVYLIVRFLAGDGHVVNQRNWGRTVWMLGIVNGIGILRAVTL